MRFQLYQQIVEKLKQIREDLEDGQASEPLLKHFDLWNRQVEFIESETPFDTPAVFVEFLPIVWNTPASQGAQNGTAKVRLHIVTPYYAQTADNVPEEIRNEQLSYLHLPDYVNRALFRFEGDFFNGWTRTQSITNHDHERYIDSVEEFTFQLFDYSSVK